jgi:hypothetical protein
MASTERLKTLNITSKQLTLLFYMAGLSCTKIPEIYKIEFTDLMKQMERLSRED